MRLYAGYGLSARLLTLTSTLIILDITKPSSSNCLLSFSRTKPNYFSSYNHGLKSWDTFVFLRRFPIHLGPTPPLTPQTMLDACIQNFFPSFNFVYGGGRKNCKKTSKMVHCLEGNREMTEKYEYYTTVPMM